MLDQFFVVFGQVITLFLLMGVGFVLGRMKKFSAVTTSELSVLLLYVVTFCVSIDTFQTDWDMELLYTLGVGTVALGVCYFFYIVLLEAFFRKDPRDLQAPLRFGAIYGNCGFMGLPLVKAVMGDEALIFAMIFITMFSVMSWTHGVVLMNGKGAFSIKKAVLNPGVLATAVGLVLMLTGLRLPQPVNNAVVAIGELNSPLAMMVIGAQMARGDLLHTFREPKLYLASAIKQLLIPAITAAVLYPFHLDPMFYVTCVILAGTPVGGTTSMFAERFGRNTERAAQLVTLSTLLSILTLPLVAVLAEALVR